MPYFEMTTYVQFELISSFQPIIETEARKAFLKIKQEYNLTYTLIFACISIYDL